MLSYIGNKKYSFVVKLWNSVQKLQEMEKYL